MSNSLCESLKVHQETGNIFLVMSNSILIIFGASDRERTAAIAACTHIPGVYCALDTADSKPCHPGNAYRANGIQPIGDWKAEEVISEISEAYYFESKLTAGSLPEVEALVAGSFDHHNEGDKGYGRPAKEAVEASSFGQMATKLCYKLSRAERIICTADHDLAATYQGMVPGVTAEEVLALRGEELAKRAGLTPEEAAIALKETIVACHNASAGTDLADMRHLGVNVFLADASAMTNIPVLGFADSRSPKKLNLFNPTAEHITKWQGELGNRFGLKSEGRYNARNLVLGGTLKNVIVETAHHFAAGQGVDAKTRVEEMLAAGKSSMGLFSLKTSIGRGVWTLSSHITNLDGYTTLEDAPIASGRFSDLKKVWQIWSMDGCNMGGGSWFAPQANFDSIEEAEAAMARVPVVGEEVKDSGVYPAYRINFDRNKVVKFEKKCGLQIQSALVADK